MRRIADIRRGLSAIPGALTNFPPDTAHSGQEPGVETTTIWEGEVGTDESVLAEVSNPDDETQNVDGSVPEFDPLIEIGADVDETFPALGGKDGEQIRQSVLLQGIDALGWYVSFHVTGAQWGIYVSISGIAYLTQVALSKMAASLNTKVHLAFHAILSHELFHFATDCAVAQAELVLQEPWWVPAKKAVTSGKPGYFVVEEQLANAYMLKAFRTMKPALRVPGKQEALRQFTRMQPEGYRDAWRTKAHHWEQALAMLAEEYGKYSARGSSIRSLWGPSSSFDWAAQFPIRPRVDWRYCPIHLVQDGARLGIPPGWLSFFSRITNIIESEKFYAKLAVLALPIQKAWERTKRRLQEAITPGADFKPWPKAGQDIFSVRVNDRVRAHLQHRRTAGDWLAIDIGGHKALGHG